MDGEIQGEWFDHHKRGDLRLIQRAIKERWPIPQAIFETAPKVIQEILTSAAPATVKLRAIMAAVSMNGQNHAAIDGETQQPGVNVTVNQYASDGGTIENKAAMDAAADWIAAMANHAPNPGGLGVVRDAGPVPSPPALGLTEQETG